MNRALLALVVVIALVFLSVIAFIYIQGSRPSYPPITMQYMTSTPLQTQSPSQSSQLVFSYGDITVKAVLPSRSITITGGGSTFVNIQMQSWIQKFRSVSGGLVIVNYQPIGSGAGEAKWFDRSLDFGAADVPISNATYQRLVASGSDFIQIPIIAGSVAIIYNLPQWDENRCGALRLSGEVLADIYLGKIIYWDDDRVKELQIEECRALLPHEPIRAIHRSDGSGTTALFTLYLSEVSEEWRTRIGYGYTVEWPRDALGYGEGGRGSDGVSAKVKGTAYSIGYVEYAYAIVNKLPTASLRNKDGNFVKPTPETVSEALKQGAKNLPPPNAYWGDVPKSFINREGPNTYPIAGLSYIFIYKDIAKDPDMAKAVSAFLKWILTEGQKPENLVEGYLPLPPELAKIAVKYVEQGLGI
ncbi:MAG: phosphate ABC transporter substrate-binding protein PstS [Sulfolobales archaeon]